MVENVHDRGSIYIYTNKRESFCMCMRLYLLICLLQMTMEKCTARRSRCLKIWFQIDEDCLIVSEAYMLIFCQIFCYFIFNGKIKVLRFLKFAEDFNPFIKAIQTPHFILIEYFFLLLNKAELQFVVIFLKFSKFLN